MPEVFDVPGIGRIRIPDNIPRYTVNGCAVRAIGNEIVIDFWTELPDSTDKEGVARIVYADLEAFDTLANIIPAIRDDLLIRGQEPPATS